MPRQHTLFGKPIPRLSPRRIAQFLAVVAIFAVVTLVFTLPNSIPASGSLSKFSNKLDNVRTSIPSIPKPHIPNLPSSNVLNPFRHIAHPPAVQDNSTGADGSSWYSDWNWLSPFSSTVTLDENRSLLPPLEKRPVIYTYYDNTIKKDSALRSAEHDLLIAWRRAWWAQGLKPVIIGPGEAMQNEFYQQLQLKGLEGGIRTEVMRWLAWESMGTGILCHHMVFPMGSPEDELLSYFRRGQFPQLRRFQELDNKLFSGSKTSITRVIKQALSSPDLKKSRDLHTFVTQDNFRIDPRPEGVAVYDTETVKDRYGKLGETIVSSPAEGLGLLNELINSHLHNTWQNTFEDGIAILKPLKQHMTALIEPAIQLAHYLANCPRTSLPVSCPPNRPNCRPCVGSTPMRIQTLPQYRNLTTLYILGVVPHPYTTATMTSMRSEIDIPFVRRKVVRDSWLSTATKELLGTGVSGAYRVIAFKTAVASLYGQARSLWFTAEKALPEDLDWHFGFVIPKNATSDGKSETPVPGPERRPKPPPPDYGQGPPPSPDELEHERQLLENARQAGVNRKDEAGRRLVNAVEAWSLADSEAWRFAGAFAARRVTERRLWEEEERKFGGGVGTDKKAGWWD